MTRSHETLRTAGEALFGPSWQSDLAAALDVNLRTMQRWAAGISRINAAVWPEIAALCALRGGVLLKMAKMLK